MHRFETAAEVDLHPDVKTHYATFFADNLKAHTTEGDLTLLFLWSPLDEDRLIENLIGHFMACKNNLTPFACFIAVAEPDSELFFTINNESGEIQLEKPGYKPLRTVADSYAEFIALLTPGWLDSAAVTR